MVGLLPLLTLSLASSAWTASVACRQEKPVADVERVSAVRDFSLRIMPLGASITAGTSLGVLTSGYRQTLRTLLIQDGWNGVDLVGTQGIPGDQHEGYPGIRTQALADQTNQKEVIGNLHPNLILLNVGTNDCTAKISREDARKVYNNMINSVFAPTYPGGDNATQFLIVSTLLPRRGADPDQRECTNYFSDVIRDLAKTHPRADRISMADMNTALTEDDIPVGDDVHPGPQGYTKMANTWFQEIRNIQGKLNRPVT